jgi:hypothetical protein
MLLLLGNGHFTATYRRDRGMDDKKAAVNKQTGADQLLSRPLAVAQTSKSALHKLICALNRSGQ